MAKKRILFLYNGGTIGQQLEVRDGHQILVSPKDGEDFKSACEPILKKFKDHLDIIFELVTTKDSTNMTPNDWEKLIFRVKKAQDEESYDAVAIAHGTDTLVYTATALSLALHGKNPKKFPDIQVNGLSGKVDMNKLKENLFLIFFINSLQSNS